MKTKALSIVITITIFFFSLSLGWGAEIYISSVKAGAKGDIEIPIMIDQINKLAGVRLILRYDPKALIFKKGIKTKYSDPLICVINSKKIGKLIIVMAGAKGISGKHFPLIKLIFKIKDKKGFQNSWIRIIEAQLVSEDLKAIKCKISDTR
ncbi:MAG: hypothetical protein DRG39_01540 [Deltaproteobacteria bacterium]|nr:MAG: hypothetical protein DRG39_01540 [Deltaproteobacteria bacterium]